MRLKAIARATLLQSDIEAASAAAIRFGKHMWASKGAAAKASGTNAPVIDELRAVERQLRLMNQLSFHYV